jgi:hypothetical protein
MPDAAPSWLGRVVRGLVALAWLGLFGHLCWQQSQRWLGLERPRDVAAVFDRHVDHDYLYDIELGGTRLGDATQAYAFTDGRRRISLRLDLQRLDALPFVGLLLPRLKEQGIDLAAGLHLDLRTDLGASFQLLEAAVDGDLGGLKLSFTGRPVGSTLRGSVQVGAAPPRPQDFRNLPLHETQGIALVAALPPGLRLDERFALRSLAPDPLPPHVRTVFTEYHVEAVERRRIRDADLDLLRVRLRREGQDAGTLWCDAEGTLYEATEGSLGMRLVLRAIRKQGLVVWPPEAVPGASAPAPAP